MCGVSRPVGCMCATVVGGGTSRWMRQATDRGPEPAERPLTFEVLVELAAVIAAVGGGREDW